MRGVYVAMVALLATVMCVSAAVPRMHRELQKLAALPRAEAVGKVRAWLLPRTRNDIDDAIVKALEALRELMGVGIPELGVPVLDPLTIPHYDLNINSELATITGNLDDLVIRNLSSFKIEQIANDLENLKADFALSFEQISLSGQYDMTGVAGGSIDIFGNGPFSLSVEGFLTGGTVYLASDSGNENSPARIDKLDIHFSVRAMQANFENLMGGGSMGELVNELIGEVGPEFIEANQVELAALISNKVQQLVNPVLGQYTLRQILDLLGVSRPAVLN